MGAAARQTIKRCIGEVAARASVWTSLYLAESFKLNAAYQLSASLMIPSFLQRVSSFACLPQAWPAHNTFSAKQRPLKSTQFTKPTTLIEK
jgi:hypothetical protein